MTNDDTDWQDIVFEGNVGTAIYGENTIIIAEAENSELKTLINTAISEGRISGSDVEGITL